MNSHTCFCFFCGLIFTMASTLLFIGRIPFRFTQKSRYFISVFPKKDFLILHLSPSSLSFLVSVTISRWSDQPPLVIINRSYMYYQINPNPRNIYFIFSWKISGELLTPIGRHLYRYFPHGRIIVHRLLDSLIIGIW